jgi:hypothetical protein
MADICEHGNENFDSVKDGNILTTWETITFSMGILLHLLS